LPLPEQESQYSTEPLNTYSNSCPPLFFVARVAADFKDVSNNP